MVFPAITVIAGLVGETVKASPVPDKYIPIAVGITGGVLGVVGMAVVSGFPATDPLSAVAVGIVSGLASTGIHQVVHQLGNDE